MSFGNKMPKLHMGDLEIEKPIIQGGMGIGVSLAGLATAVANEGGVGVISGTVIGMLEPDFDKDFSGANKRAFRREIVKARQMTKGVIGVNLMVALTDYMDIFQIAIEEGADIVFVGAGLPTALPDSILEGQKGSGKAGTKVVPIVSSARAARVIFQYWKKHFGRVPDGVVVEGPLAGGHLGFSREQIDDPAYALEQILPEVVSVVKPHEEAYGNIPVIAAGGIFSGVDIRQFLQLGADGVQMATRFVATHECDAAREFKEAYVRCTKDDLVIIDSPVGLPGRAIRNSFLTDVMGGKRMPYRCYWHCLKSCDYQGAPYCICEALKNAKLGDLGRGFAFAGAKTYMVDSIVSVKELMETLAREYEEAQLVRSYPDS